MIVPPPTAGIVSYSAELCVSLSRSWYTLAGGELPESFQSTISNELYSSSYSPISLDSSSSSSSVKSARPLLGVKRLLKPRNTLLVGSPSGRRPYVGSKFSKSGWEDVDGSWVGERGKETDLGWPEPTTEAPDADAGRGRLEPTELWDVFR